MLRPFGGKIPKRVKTQTAAAAELGDVKVMDIYGHVGASGAG